MCTGNCYPAISAAKTGLSAAQCAEYCASAASQPDADEPEALSCLRACSQKFDCGLDPRIRQSPAGPAYERKTNRRLAPKTELHL